MEISNVFGVKQESVMKQEPEEANPPRKSIELKSVIVESGPVQYDEVKVKKEIDLKPAVIGSGEVAYDEADDYFDDEPEEEEHVSAAQLFGRGHDDDDGEYNKFFVITTRI